MKTTPLFYKERTSVSLNSILLSHPFFNENWKLIPSVIRTLNQVLRWNHKDEGFSSITRTFFRDRFGNDYGNILRALDTLGLVIIDRTWRKKGTQGKDDSGKCFDYYLPLKCQRALADTNKEYLYKLLNDKPTKRKNQKAISKRGKHFYNDIRDTLREGLDNIRIDFTEVEKVIETMPAGKRAVVWSLLIDIERKDYSGLKYNEKDGRVWTPYAQLPAEIKRVIHIDGLKYQATIDIRSCYPSLWSEYVSTLCGFDSNCEKERQKWNNIFLNPDLDPKAFVVKSIGVSREEIKAVMIKYFNGCIRGKAFRLFDAWLSKEFPRLHSLWQSSDVKQTGNNIGKYFETRLMLDESIYKKAEQLGIVLGYEYDGMSFYAENDNHCEALLNYIEQRSIELLGVKLVFVDKTNTLSIPDMARDNNLKHLEQVREKWLKLCRFTFRKDNLKPDWEHFREERARYYREVSSCLSAV